MQTTAGPGPDPLIDTGSAYLTGPYKGGPFGIAVEVPAIAGPLNLETVVVRSSIHIDRSDAHVTVVSDPSQILDATGTDGQTDGFRVHLRSVSVAIDRPGFEFNPTSCNPMSVNGTAGRRPKAPPRASPTPLPGRRLPDPAVPPGADRSTQGPRQQSRRGEPDVKVTSPGLGQANIAKVFLTIPKILPSRLQPTLQHACPAAIFEANPAGCDEDSLIGYATVHTPS